MLVRKYSGRIYAISAKLEPEEIKSAKDYIQAAVWNFCADNPAESFAVRDLFGGNNADWSGTPLQAIYKYHSKFGAADAKDRARKDVGKLLKEVLAEEESYYEQSQDGKTKMYRKLN